MNPLPHAAPENTCVWMEAGVLSFRLCDRAFDCEHCPLDRALRGGSDTTPPRGSTVGGPAEEVIPDGVLFHPSHLWIAPSGSGEWKFGLDQHALMSFSRPIALSLPRPGKRVNPGEEAVALVIDGEALRWPAPMEFVILERNERWQEAGDQRLGSPYEDGWSLLIKLPRAPSPAEWTSATVMRGRNAREDAELRDFVFSHDALRRSIGRTAADGGNLVDRADQILPLRLYLDFLRRLWSLLPAVP